MQISQVGVNSVEGHFRVSLRLKVSRKICARHFIERMVWDAITAPYLLAIRDLF